MRYACTHNGGEEYEGLNTKVVTPHLEVWNQITDVNRIKTKSATPRHDTNNSIKQSQQHTNHIQHNIVDNKEKKEFCLVVCFMCYLNKERVRVAISNLQNWLAGH